MKNIMSERNRLVRITATCGALALATLFCSCSKPVEKSVVEIRQKTVEEYAATLRKDHDSIHIYEVNGRYEVWSTKPSGKWRDAATLEEARKIVADYYTQWAKNCMGDQTPANRIE